MPCFKFGF
ncbi:hypothetical protein F383_29803 [Gossypium arboreum]|uniref:Uncharacterized protein n=1 Tax=Gossypium arboreum TaxID=29729 RepID=A0A0B0MTJ5_GOSAR|nr:hypothetical protein F383_29803 [Gossypium arboreum]